MRLWVNRSATTWPENSFSGLTYLLTYLPVLWLPGRSKGSKHKFAIAATTCLLVANDVTTATLWTNHLTEFYSCLVAAEIIISMVGANPQI